ncbi:hypothetical protein CHH80_07465 [Bacillus sp. 7504-2]|nr:hypothetical protein CHH80_07465 [Bacillus sp. 7504-2]
MAKSQQEKIRMIKKTLNRDGLRASETDWEESVQVKRSLAKSKWHHVQHYADAKASIVQEIMERANGVR